VQLRPQIVDAPAQPVTAGVPEPDTLALLAIGLATLAIGAMCTRR
jgi:PEP-CTERM motif